MYQITRSELYQKVWKKPMVKVSKEFGISDRGLAKVCKKHNIPVPYPGYWARFENGYEVKKQPLKGNPEEIVEFNGQDNDYAVRILAKGKKKANEVYSRIASLKFLANIDEVTSAVSKYINSYKKSNEYGKKFLINPKGKKISICNLNGAVRVLANIEHMANCLGGSISYGSGALILKLWNNEFQLEVFEICEKFWQRKEKINSWGRSEYDECSYNETNKFAIFVENCPELRQRCYSMTEKCDAEHAIKRMLKALFMYDAHKRIAQIKSSRLCSEWRKRDKERELDYKARQEINDKLELLKKQISRWQEAEVIRGYVHYFIHNIVKQKANIKSATEVREYIAFIKSYADKIDPISDYLRG